MSEQFDIHHPISTGIEDIGSGIQYVGRKIEDFPERKFTFNQVLLIALIVLLIGYFIGKKRY
jgi:hypothetical protein